MMKGQIKAKWQDEIVNKEDRINKSMDGRLFKTKKQRI